MAVRELSSTPCGVPLLNRRLWPSQKLSNLPLESGWLGANRCVKLSDLRRLKLGRRSTFYR